MIDTQAKRGGRSAGKIVAITAIAMVLGSQMAFAATVDEGMSKALLNIGTAVAGVGIFLLIGIVASWIYLPLGIGLLALSFYKKKSEQSHEDNSLKAAGAALIGGIFGVMASFIIVGTFGNAISDSGGGSLADGNRIAISAIMKPIKTRLQGIVESGTGK